MPAAFSLSYSRPMGRTAEKFSFLNAEGKTLAGIIDMPARPPLFFGVFAPCFTCVKESHGAAKICRALAERGVAILRFDMTGLGESKGDFADTHFSSRISDIVSACRALEAAYAAPKLLIGHSISGTAALSAIHQLPGIKTLVTVGSPRDPESVIEKFRKLGHMTVREDGIELNVLGRITPFKNTFLDDMLSQDVAGDTARITQKLLVFHAPNDDIVTSSQAEDIIARATSSPGRKLFLLDEAATHLFEKRNDDAVFVAEKILENIDVS